MEHLRRHRHTSGVVQGANRSRNLDAPVYLLSGEPLDGLPWDVPVELYTSREFVELLNLNLETDTSEPKEVNESLQTINEERANQAQARLENLMPGVREYANQLGRVPGIRALRSFMGTDGKLVSQELAEKAQAILHEEIMQERVQEEIEENHTEKASESNLLLFEMDVPDTLYINQKDFKPASDTFHSKPEEQAQTPEESKGLGGQLLPESIVVEPSDFPEQVDEDCGLSSSDFFSSEGS